MIAEKNLYIESAYQQLKIINQDKQKRLEYEAREKAMRDYNQQMFEAEQRGEKRVNALNTILIESNRIDDLKRATIDKDFQTLLIQELLPKDLL